MERMARILVGVTGGIAAYKACELVRLLVRAGHEVVPVVTAGAERFVRAETFQALARWTPDGDPYPHLRRVDLLVVAPLTANTLARLAHGLADDALTEAALAAPRQAGNRRAGPRGGRAADGPGGGRGGRGRVRRRPDERARGDRRAHLGAARRLPR